MSAKLSTMGLAKLVAGEAVVVTPEFALEDSVLLDLRAAHSGQHYWVPKRGLGTFTIRSSDPADTSSVGWEILKHGVLDEVTHTQEVALEEVAKVLAKDAIEHLGKLFPPGVGHSGGIVTARSSVIGDGASAEVFVSDLPPGPLSKLL